ncbi:MAG: MBL fold metallo-hydrolase [Christensenellales bacterium]|jgi:L-ascorbate metabolism protein UlaG (beta-lactamase superfamily)
MKIRWLGHSCFMITAQDGSVLITDPFDETVGYPLPHYPANIVSSSHDHFDHNHFSAVQGDFVKVTQSGETKVGSFTFFGTPTFHDEEKGTKRGQNIVYNISVDGLNICHCGDLGHPLNEALAASIGKVDVLLVPVGGVFTIDAAGAKDTVDKLSPAVVIPMHYKTADLTFDISDADSFLQAMDGWDIKKAPNEFIVDAATLPQHTILLPDSPVST